MFEDTLLRPGQITPELVVVAHGLPDIARFWATPDVTKHLVEDEEEHDLYREFSDSGTTVSVVPVPAGSTPLSLTRRLQRVAGAACDRPAWMPDGASCSALTARLADVPSALSRGDTPAARHTLRSVARQLDAAYCGRAGDTGPDDPTDVDPAPCDLRPLGATNAPATLVNAEGYALLRPNVTYLLLRLGGA
jgi:hypothetical protein